MRSQLTSNEMGKVKQLCEPSIYPGDVADSCGNGWRRLIGRRRGSQSRSKNLKGKQQVHLTHCRKLP